MSSNPKISVISGYYNRENNVDESIQSVLDQSFTDFELIVFDDCSKDNTYQKLKAFADKDERVKLVRPDKNKGFVNGMIDAVNMAKGKYIAVHGSGDLSLKERLAKQYEYLENNPQIPMVSSFYANKDADNSVYKVFKADPVLERSLFLRHNPLSQGGVLFRKDVYHKAGGYRSIFKYSQDRDLWLRISKFGNIAVLQEVLYERMINYDGVSYKEDKLIDQKKFSLFACKINELSDKEQLEAEAKVKSSGIDSVINVNEPTIQRGIFKMFNVLFAKNKLNNTKIFIDNSRGLYKVYYQLMKSMYNNKTTRKLVNKVYKAYTK